MVGDALSGPSGAVLTKKWVRFSPLAALNVTVIEPRRELRCHPPIGTLFSHVAGGKIMRVLLTAAVSWAAMSFLFSWFWGIAISRGSDPSEDEFAA
jgi:hypothetical protein